MEARVEDANVEVEAAVPERAHKRVDPKARADGHNMHRISRHEPQYRERRRAEARVEEIGGVSVASVCPPADGLYVAGSESTSWGAGEYARTPERGYS